MLNLSAQSSSTWAEDRALQRCNPSTVPGVGVEGRTGLNPGSVSCPQPSTSTPKRKTFAARRRDLIDRMSPLQLTNANHPGFHFTLNQDTHASSSL